MMLACNKELEFYGERPVTAMNTIREDINQITSNYPDAIIISQRVGRNIYYSYSDSDYSIFKIPFKDEELAQLTQTITILTRFKGLPQFDWLDDFIDRFNSTIYIDQPEKPIVGFDENIDLKGRNFFATLFNAICEKQVLDLKYKNFSKQIIQEFTVHPYYLKQYNKRWFLLGFSEEFENISIFAFDRIVSINPIHKTYRSNTNWDFDEYFEDMIGVTKPKNSKLDKIILKISHNRWPYINTKPLHGTQRILSTDKYGVTIQIEVYPNKELEQLILSFGEDLEVIAPNNLRDKIAGKLKASLKNYQ